MVSLEINKCSIFYIDKKEHMFYTYRYKESIENKYKNRIDKKWEGMEIWKKY